MDLETLTSIDLYNYMLNAMPDYDRLKIYTYTDKLRRRGEIDLLHSLVINLAFEVIKLSKH